MNRKPIDLRKVKQGMSVLPSTMALLQQIAKRLGISVSSAVDHLAAKFSEKTKP